jgi:prepilin-type N-terminal cleavage/methylation domain-containing protein
MPAAPLPNPTNCPVRRRQRKQTGLGLIELLISLAIVAMLLTAVGTAFSASSKIINENDQFQRASQGARVALHQILTEIRRCDAVDISTHVVEVLRPESVRETGELSRRYRYDATTGRLLMAIVHTDGTTSDEYVLARNISTLTFGKEMGVNSNNTACVVRATMTLTVSIGDNSVGMSGSAAPRRSRRYLAA